MSARSILRTRIAWMVLFCFFSLVSLHAWPAANQIKLLPGHDRAAKAAAASAVFFEKEGSAKAPKSAGRRFPLLIVLGAAVAVGVLVYFLATKKDKADDGDQPPVIEPAGTVTDYDGNVYRAVRIGNQIWMAENLRSTHSSDGTPITGFVYDDDPAQAAVYGRLYAAEAFMKGSASSNANPSGVRGIAPAGWHIPSPTEWLQLAGALGGEQVAGGKLKESGTAHWQSPNTAASNESLFCALPAGYRGLTGLFHWLGTRSAFATSQWDETHQTMFSLWHDRAELTSDHFHPLDAVSVRCVKD